MKKLCLVAVYFGTFPNYFQLWLNSCKYNKNIDWLVVTDSPEDYLYPDNVKVQISSLGQIKKRIEKILGFRCSLERPYKLCDYRPVFPSIFFHTLKDYEYWGHCDLDCIWGNLEKFVMDKLDGCYEKIGALGHLTIYQNRPDINERYKLVQFHSIDYKKVFTSNYSYGFDENTKYGINSIYLKEEYRNQMYLNDTMCADVYPYHYKFFLARHFYVLYNVNGKEVSFFWKLGELFCISGNKQSEVGYVHLQKRKMELCNNNTDSYFIIPNAFSDINKKAEPETYIIKNEMMYALRKWKDALPVICRKIFDK